MRGPIRTLFGLTLILFVKSQEFQKCNLRNGAVGTCQHVLQCTSAKKELQQRLHPISCGFSGRYPLVCCDQNKAEIAQGRTSNRISEEKCREYLKLDIKTTISTTTTTTTPKPAKTFSFNPYVIKGVNAYYEEYPHMAILGYGPSKNLEFKCGGSLISDQFVLTAAHCLESRESGPVSSVRLGDLDIASTVELAEPQNFKVQKVFTFPEYDSESFYHDIALIKLDRPVIYTRYVKPACLQSKFELENNNLTITGWGALEFGGQSHSYLQKAPLRSLPAENCARSLPKQAKLANGFDEELQICGGDLETMVDACQGDSGGPMQLKIQELPQMYRIAGVTSFGNNCGLVPGVYTRVSNYISWIESVVWPN
nr:serine protease snake-like [Onthophagus taurus]